ncbi:unnamed protein product [Gadus morhua 'NCC']
MMENREQPCPDPVIPEHFGAFDNSVSLYSGFDNSNLTAPRHPTTSQSCDCTIQTTLNIPDFPSEPADDPSASHQSEDDSSQDILTRQATATVLTARERHHLSQTGVNDVVAAMQQYQALLWGCSTEHSRMTAVALPCRFWWKLALTASGDAGDGAPLTSSDYGADGSALSSGDAGDGAPPLTSDEGDGGIARGRGACSEPSTSGCSSAMEKRQKRTSTQQENHHLTHVEDTTPI